MFAMSDDVRFAPDLYRGSAAHYDRYRLPYPGVLISDLVSRSCHPGRHEFGVEPQWTLPELAGLIRTTSFLPASVLAEHGAEFDADLTSAHGPYTTEGRLGDTVGFAGELASA